MNENAEKKDQLTNDQLLLLQTLQVPLLLLDQELRVAFVNDYYLSVFEKAEHEVTGCSFFDLEKAWQTPHLRKAFEALLAEKGSFKNISGPHPGPDKGNEGVHFSASLLPGTENFILLSLSEQKNKMGEKKEPDHLQEFFFQAPAAIAIVHGPDFIYSLSNSRYEQLFNRTREELLGKGIREVFPEIEGQGVYELFDQVYESGEAFIAQEYPVNFKRKEGGRFEVGYFNFIAHPIKDASGNVTDIMIHTFEVTEQILAKRQLEESEKLYRDLVQSVPSMMATYKGEEMIIEVVNEAMLNAWGKDRSVVGKSFFEVLPELREQGFQEMIKEVFATGEPHKSYEMPVDLYRDGVLNSSYYSFIFYPKKDLNGKVTGILHTASEVTPEAELHKKIRESEAHFRQMADLMPAKITNNDPKGRAIYFNQAWLDFAGIGSDEMKDRGWNETIHPEDLPILMEKWRHSLATGEPHEAEFRMRDRNNQYIWQLTRGVPVKNAAGKIEMWITSTTDIQRLKEEEKRKEEFLRMVSHELKTPVTSIKGYVQLLISLLNSSKVDLPASLPVNSSLQRIDQQINRLTRLISEMLDLSRIENSKLDLRLEKFNINEMVKETIQDILYTNPQLEIEVINDFNCQVLADKDRLGQVLINFVTNAIKYSANDQEIIVRIFKGQQGHVAVSIEDNGIGIAQEDLVKIFQRFYRSAKINEDTYAGFGIGLFLAKEIVERHKGRVLVESVLGKGSVFTFTIPCVAENES